MTHDVQIRLCLKDLYHQDVVEMIERETRRYRLSSIEDPEHPDFDQAYDLLWSAFGPAGELESKAVITRFLREDRFRPLPSGTLARYFLIVARDHSGAIRGVRDGCVLVNQEYSSDLCLVYLSHIYMRPEARGTVLTYWLRIAPVELAMQYLHDLSVRGLVRLPAADAPGRYFGMRLNLAAEMEYFSPDDKQSLQRILFYGRGGFDAIDPRHFPYRQPDFRDCDEIRSSANSPVPFMLLLRRMGREREARLPLDEAAAVMRLLYDDFARFCAPEFLRNSLDIVLSRLSERRQRGKQHVDLLPLPTGPKDVHRLRRFFRHDIFLKYYRGDPGTLPYLSSGIIEKLAANPKYLEQEIARIAIELDRPHSVYASRDRGFTWDGTALPDQQWLDTASEEALRLNVD